MEPPADDRDEGTAAGRLRAGLGAAGALFRSGSGEQAIERLKALEREFPREVEVKRTLGIGLSRLGRDREALAVLRRALPLAPNSATLASDCANVLLNLGAGDEALLALQPFTAGIEGGPASAELLPVLFNLARAYKWAGRVEEAVAPLERVLAAEPRHYGARLVLGDVFKALGRVTAAGVCYRRAIALNPDDATAWWALTNLKAGALTAAEFAQLRAVSSRAAGTPQRIFLEFALASAHDQRGEIAAAFAHYETGNRLKRLAEPWDRIAFERWLAQIEETMAGVPLPPRPVDLGHPRPIFIVSLPRSGSTLTEQILAAHSQVAAASELPWVPRLLATAGGPVGPLAERLGGLGAGEWRALGQAYLDRAAWWHRHRPVFTDKLPGNLALAATLLAMLPDALVVHVRRDPRDVCWSCYRQLFVSGSEFAYDLADIAAYWRATGGAMERLKARAPGRVLEMSYEDLVSWPERETRRLLDFAGLPFEPACLRPQDVQRAVNTASAAQVREAVHTQGIGHWRRYAAHLGMFETLFD